MTGLIVAIDGPAAAGKGTLAVALAKHLSLPHLDTGLLYRVVGRRVLLAGFDPENVDARPFAEQFTPADLQRSDLRAPEVDRAASLVAAQPYVRAALLLRQREFASAHGAVVDGRDIGTAVFPRADVKLYVTASAATRAMRRYQQFHPGAPIDAAAVALIAGQITDRDRIDSERAVSPLRMAEDAILIETDNLLPEHVFTRALEAVEQHCKNKS